MSGALFKKKSGFFEQIFMMSPVSNFREIHTAGAALKPTDRRA
jgi:hypothetical protein